VHRAQRQIRPSNSIPIDSNKAVVEVHMYDPAESYGSRSLIVMPRGRELSNRTIDAIER
jgi:hypothetical protein